ncbi:MAG: LPS export ABC transporter periplasmic protein LptC, partial [Pyrinomonadaceae bacterium]
MNERATDQIQSWRFRKNLPRFVRFAAIACIALVLLAVGIGLYRAKNVADFRMIGFPTELSKEVISKVDSYERREFEGDNLKYHLIADQATTFSDNHQELSNVHLQLFGTASEVDEITAAKAVYVPGEQKTFTGYFAGDVNVKTRDGLKLRTEQITYTDTTKIISAEENVQFERANVSGKSFGAIVRVNNHTVELPRDVEFALNGANGNITNIKSGRAVYIQLPEAVEFYDGVSFESNRGSTETVSATANFAKASLVTTGTDERAFTRIDMNGNVAIDRKQGSEHSTATAASATYDKTQNRFELSQNVVIEVAQGDGARRITGEQAFYQLTEGKFEISGSAEISGGGDSAKGDRIVGELRGNGMLQLANAIGNAYVSQNRDGQQTEMNANEIHAKFDAGGEIAFADTAGQTRIFRQSEAAQSSTIEVNADSKVKAAFRPQGLFDQVATEGRTTIKFDSPNDVSSRQISADSVKSVFQTDGRSMKRAEAVGDAEFLIEPHKASVENNRVKVNSPRIDCDFYANANSPSVCVGERKAKLVRSPTVSREGRGEQIVTSEKLTARFDQKSSAVNEIEAFGNAKFVELDRNASANSIYFNAVDESVKLRGGEPTAWDSTARLKANEIDWDTKNKRSSYRGSVTSTYYKANGMGKGTPFGDSDKPAYVTSEKSELDHSNEIAVYTGNARAWQGTNYVRAVAITFKKRESI